MSRKAILILAICCLAAVIGGSLMPSINKQRLHLEPREHHNFTARIMAAHRLAHYAAFSAITFLLLLLCRSRKQEVTAVVVTILLALLLEIAEHLMYHTMFESFDVWDDAKAAFVTAGAYWCFRVLRPASR